MTTCRYLVAKGDGFSPWYWCQHLGKQVHPGHDGCTGTGCPKLRAAAARAARQDSRRRTTTAKPKRTTKRKP
jgi:hypothetical protein